MIQNHLRRYCRINLVSHNFVCFCCLFYSLYIPQRQCPVLRYSLHGQTVSSLCARGLHKDNNPPIFFSLSLDSRLYAFDLFLVVNVTSPLHSFIISIKLGSIRLSPYFLEKIGHLLIHVLIPRSVFIHISFCRCNIKYRN